MEFRQLRYFIAVAEEGNIGRAAERLHVSQPPISRQIQALEHELNAKLFVRTPKGVDLTDAGQIFLNDAKKVLAQTRTAIDRTRAAERGELGQLDLAFFGSTVYGAVPLALRAFRRAFPDITVTLTRMGKKEQVDAVRDGRIHAGFGRYFQMTDDIAAEHLVDEPLYAAVPADLALSRRKSLSLEDLNALSAVLYPSGDRPSFADEIIRVFSDEGRSLTVDTVASDSAAALAMVACGGRFTLVPQAIAAMRFPTLRYVPLNDKTLTAPSSCIFLRKNQPPVLREFLKVIRTVSFNSELDTL
ncbi:LysR family transcriptional regulator [uncultured Tateyamaria sp.]|uniref:LysR family transcriptional regulator n=1 Tax=uncultured Tateyamaria sp. TaxID=455651 RepID=UPI00262CACE5|nr:LysR family transcriptional regulator [uncultured Tateyamaria sp.]